MKRVPRERRVNARGDRWCIGCEVYLHPSSFEQWANGKIESRCHACRRAQSNASRQRRYLDDATWQRDLAVVTAHRKRRRRQRQDERAAFVIAAIERMRDQGFTLAEIGALAGVRRCTLGDILAGRNAYIWATTEERITRAWRVTMGLPETGRPTSDRTRPPHPALDLVRARLARMDYLAELEAAA